MGFGARGMHEWGECGLLMPFILFMPCADIKYGNQHNVVDIFNVALGSWRTAALSQARANLAATSLPNAEVAIFAGGQFCTCCCVLVKLLQDGFWCEGDA